jgi:uncharacterized protein YaiI (UPF0178 family)
VPAGSDERVRTVHAPADGDAMIADLARRAIAEDRRVVVVTADRALAATVQDAGAEVVGPGWLLGQVT